MATSIPPTQPSGVTSAATSIATSLASGLASTAAALSSSAAAASSALLESSTAAAAPAETNINGLLGANDGAAQKSEGVSLQTFVASLAVASLVFGIEVILFVLLRKKLKRVYEPRTYLVPEKYVPPPPHAAAAPARADAPPCRRRTAAPAAGFFNFFAPVRAPRPPACARR